MEKKFTLVEIKIKINLKIKMKKIRLKEIKGLCKTPKTISYRRKIS